MTLHSDQPVWVIGDVQGCFDSLLALLEHPEIKHDHQALLCFAGDLINRGPKSLDCLRYIHDLGPRAISLLGNHDIHLLGVAAGVRKLSKSDTAGEILQAPDANALIEWLRQRPLSAVIHNHLIVHAGVAPQWDTEQCLAVANEVEQCLRADSWQETIGELFGNTPLVWDDRLSGSARLRFIVNALTRMRTCYADGSLNFEHKGPPSKAEGELAWFDLPQRKPTLPVLFGHWSTLGLNRNADATCLDTGCVWGRELTAMRLPDRHIVQIPCQESTPRTPTRPGIN